MNSYQRTDLAVEFCTEKTEKRDIEETFKDYGFCKLERIKICSESASARIGRPMGEYFSFLSSKIDRLSKDDLFSFTELLGDKIVDLAKNLCEKEIDSEFSVFVAGLGNRELTPDAIGPKVVDLLKVTRHIKKFDRKLFSELGCACVAGIVPGVFGETGMESSELLASAVKKIKPDLLLVIDALAAGSCDRLATTVQLSNVGIVPGSGVANHRNAINRQSMGVPVLSIGIPTVVSSSTLVWDALEKAGVESPSDKLIEILENGKSFFVSPKECDLIVQKSAELLANAINSAFVGELEF